jgi:YD repeat-containing protein
MTRRKTSGNVLILTLAVLGLLCSGWRGCGSGGNDDPDPSSIDKPCQSRPGGAKAWEGILCNGNLQMVAPLSTVGIGLVYNSLDSIYQEGFGHGWRLSVRSTLAVDELGNVTITRPDGTPVAFDFNGTSWEAEPLQFSRLARDDQDNFVETFPGGLRYVYKPASGRFFLQQMVDRNGNTTTVQRDDQDRETYLEDAYGRKVSFHWENGLLQAVEDHEGRTFSLGYNQAEELETITHPEIEAGTPVVQFYYGSGSTHFLTAMVTPEGSITDFGYHQDGSLKMVTDPSGYAMLVQYTNEEVIQKYSHGEQAVQHFVDGQLMAQGNEVGVFTHYHRDRRHRVTRITDHLGYSWEMEYNHNDDMVRHLNPMGQETLLEYDDDHNIVSVQRHGLRSSYEYDGFNQITSATNPIGQTTTYERDERGNLTRLIDHTGVVRAQAEYNPDGSLHSTTDMYGDTTTYQYDEYGNVTSVSHPDFGDMTAESTPTGLVKEKVSSAGDTTRMTYDDRAGLIGVEHRGRNTKGEPGVIMLSLARDGDNRVVGYQVCGPDGCDSASRDLTPAGNVARETANGQPVQDGECPCVESPAP